MNLDARSITIGLSVVLLVAIAWVLVANSEEDPGTTTLVAVTTTPTTEVPTTQVTTTTVEPSTSAVPSTTTTTAAPTTTEGPTTTAAPMTSNPIGSTVTIPPPLEEPDLTMCRENDLPDRLCRWVGVEYPKITADPEEEPLRWLRQYADFLDWTDANPEIGHALKNLATTGQLLDELTQRARDSLEAGEKGLPRTSIEPPVDVFEGEDLLTIEATVVLGPSYVLDRDGELVRSFDDDPPARWRFELRLTDEGWRAADMRSAE